jgi:hypothetical protein
LAPQIQKLYEQVKVELFEKKHSASSELVQELQRRIDDIGLALAITVRSIDAVQKHFSQVDVRILVDSCLYGYRLLVENLAVLICRKYLLLSIRIGTECRLLLISSSTRTLYRTSFSSSSSPSFTGSIAGCRQPRRSSRAR